MVNIINESNALNDDYSLFSLTKPLPPLQTNNYPKLNGFKMNNNNNNNTTLFNDSSFNFTFLEPFESYHLKHKYTNGATNGGKLLNKTLVNQRKQPYTLSKPTQPVITQQPSKNNVELVDENDTKQNGFNQNAILARLSSISSTFKSIFVRPKNTKLVDIKSIQNDTLLNTKSKQDSEPTKFKLELFSCSSTISTNDIMNNNKNESQFDLNSKLENIIKQNVLMESLNSSRNLITKSNDQHQKLGTNNLLNSPHSSSSSSSSTKSTLSTTSNLTTDSLMSSSKTINQKTSETHQRASMMTMQLNNQSILKTTNNSSVLNNTNNNINTSTLQNQQKWTCLICLSKHRLDIKICNICGSLQQNSSHSSSSSSSNKPKFQKYTQKDSHSTTSSQSSTNSNQLLNNSTNNQYLIKTWTCYYCNYANDCLKIVCMNCRSSKQQQLNEIKTSLSHQTIQLKRARNQTIAGITTTTTTVTNGVKYKLNTSNEENELNDSVDDLEVVNNKKSKKIKCSQCSSCSHSNTTTTTTNNTNNPSTPLENQLKNSNLVAKLNGATGTGPNLITPTKPSNYNKYDNATNVNEAAQLLNSNNSTPSNKKTSEMVKSPLAKPIEPIKPITSSSKWTCSTCLVQNDESKSSCACCSTARPSLKDTVDSKPQQPSSSSSLSSNLSSKSSKWTCSTCLVSNEADKDECACCMTKRNLSTSSSSSSNQLKSNEDSTNKTKFSTLVAAAGSNVLTFGNNLLSLPSTNTDSSISKSISFGLKPNEANGLNEPIKFGSNSSIFPSQTETKPSTPSFGFMGSNNNKPVEPVQSFGTSMSTSSSNSNGANNFSFMNTPAVNPTTNSAPLFGTNANTTNASSNSTPMFGTSSFGSSQATTTTISEEKPKFFISTTPATNLPSPLTTNSSATTSFFGSTKSTLTNVTEINNPTPTPTSTTSTFQFGNNGTNSSNTSQTPTPASTSTFTFGTNTSNASNSSSFFNNGNTTATSSAPSLFGNSNQKESNSSFQINNPFANKNEPNKPTETATIKTEKPNNTLLSFGFTNSSSSSNTSNTNNNQSSSVFSTNNNNNNNQSSSSVNLFGASSSNSNSNSSTFNFGNSTTNKNSEPAKLPQPTFTFGQSNNSNSTTETKPPVFGGSSTSSSANVFGSLLSSVQQQQPSSAPTASSSAFKFGQSTASTPSTTSNSSSAFVFGGANSTTNTEKPSTGFNFGSSQPSFNFSTAATTATDLNMTPKRPETPSSNTTPFVFGGGVGAGAPQQGTNNLSQILTPSTTTPGTRQIKKPTRRLKK